MPASKSPIRVLADSLSAMPVLKGRCRVLAGKNALVKGRSLPSIVIFPSEGGYDSPNDNVGSLVDIDLKVVARVWAADIDEAWDLRVRYLQALRQAAIGNPSNPALARPDQAGSFYELLTEEWDTEPDSAENGQELEVTCSIRLSAAPTIQLKDGEIDATGLHGLSTMLTAPLAAGDVVAVVDSTAGFAASGELSIEREQLSYTGITPTSFTGLVRALNGTTATTHDTSTTVTQ